MPGLLKVVLPVVGGVLAVSNLMPLVNPTAFFETVGMGSIVAESETPLAKSLIVNMAVAKIVLGALGVASYFRGSETRARIGTAIAVLLAASIYAAPRRRRAPDPPPEPPLVWKNDRPKRSKTARRRARRLERLPDIIRSQANKF